MKALFHTILSLLGGVVAASALLGAFVLWERAHSWERVATRLQSENNRLKNILFQVDTLTGEMKPRTDAAIRRRLKKEPLNLLVQQWQGPNQTP